MQLSVQQAKNMTSDYTVNIIRDLINCTGQPLKNLLRLFSAGVSYDIVKAIIERIPNFSSIYVDIAFDIFQAHGKELFREYLDLGFPQQVINLEGDYVLPEQWPSIEENAIIASPLGSGKSSCIIQKIKENPNKKMLIVCPRNEICDQYVEWLHQADIIHGRMYAQYRDKIRQVMVTNFDKLTSMVMKYDFDWIVVDEFHALCDDDLFRGKQNMVAKSTLCRTLSFGDTHIHLVSATPKRSALELFRNRFEFTVYMFVSQKQPKPLTFYVSSDPAITALDLITKTNERCIIHQNDITSNNKLATLLQDTNRKCTSIHAGSRDLLKESLSNYQCIFVTSVIDSGRSIDDGIPSKVFTVGNRERLSSILQRAARVRENVSEHNIILKKTNTNLRQGEPFQVWNCGMWDFDKTDIPEGWSGLHQTREDYIQKDIAFISVEEEYYLVEQVVRNPNLVSVFNQELAQRFGFYISEVNHDYEDVGKFSIDIFVDEFKQIFNQGTHHSDISFLLSSIQVLGYMQQLPPALNAFFDYAVQNYQIDVNVIGQISKRFLTLCRGERTIALDAQREIIDFCLKAIQTYDIPENDIIPSSINEWMDQSPQQRKYISELGSQMLTSMACVADPEYIRAPGEDPVQFNTGKLFKRWVDERTEIEFSVNDIKSFLDQYIRYGWIPAHAENSIFIGNPNYIELNKIQRCFKASLAWVCDKVKRGRNVYYIWNDEKWEKFLYIIKQYGKVATCLKSHHIPFPFSKYENLHRYFHRCFPLFLTLSRELT